LDLFVGCFFFCDLFEQDVAGFGWQDRWGDGHNFAVAIILFRIRTLPLAKKALELEKHQHLVFSVWPSMSQNIGCMKYDRH
jgi:hypothetical protein